MVRVTNKILKAISIICFVVLLLEVYLAVCGYKIVTTKNLAYINLYDDEEVEFIKKSGWGNPQGVDNEDKSVFINCWENGMRRCRPEVNKPKKSLKVAMVGCSYIFGLGVNDEDTMVWRLNEKYPDVVFDNWGVQGAGPIQIYARIEHLLKKHNDYDLIVYNGFWGQMSRNCVPRAIGQVSKNGVWSPVPYAKRDIFGRYRVFYIDDQRFLFEENSLLIDFFKRLLYLYYTTIYQNYYSPPALSNDTGGKREQFVVNAFTESINNMKLLCDKYNKKFLVCILEDRPVKFNGEKQFNILGSNSNLNCEVVDVSMPNNEQLKAEYRVMNHVGYHPNAKVHAYWAEKFSKYFDKKYMK